MLQKFLTDGIIGDVVRETNRYAEQDWTRHPASYTDWKPVDLAQIWQFLAITFMMGLVKKPSIREYWSTDELIQTPFFATVMSRNRYDRVA